MTLIEYEESTDTQEEHLQLPVDSYSQDHLTQPIQPTHLTQQNTMCNNELSENDVSGDSIDIDAHRSMDLNNSDEVDIVATMIVQGDRHIDDKISDVIVDSRTKEEERKRSELLKKYINLPSAVQKLVISTVKSIKESCIFYKNLSHMYPDWFDFKGKGWDAHNPAYTKAFSLEMKEREVSRSGVPYKNGKNVVCRYRDLTTEMMEDIGYYMLCRVIDDKFIEIPHYRRMINNPFHRGLWHMLRAFRMSLALNCVKDEIYINDMNKLTDKIFKMLDVFCLFSRLKTEEYYISAFNNLYCCVTSLPCTGLHIPLNIYNNYSKVDIPILLQTAPSLVTLGVDPEIVYMFLCDEFEHKIVKLSELVFNRPVISNNTMVTDNQDMYDHSPASNNWRERNTRQNVLHQSHERLVSLDVDDTRVKKDIYSQPSPKQKYYRQYGKSGYLQTGYTTTPVSRPRELRYDNMGRIRGTKYST